MRQDLIENHIVFVLQLNLQEIDERFPLAFQRLVHLPLVHHLSVFDLDCFVAVD